MITHKVFSKIQVHKQIPILCRIAVLRKHYNKDSVCFLYSVALWQNMCYRSYF